jgi:hypothetical protein
MIDIFLAVAIVIILFGVYGAYVAFRHFQDWWQQRYVYIEPEYYQNVRTMDIIPMPPDSMVKTETGYYIRKEPLSGRVQFYDKIEVEE